MAGFPMITATAFSLRLIEIACHPSYPLKSENARPPGTFTVYLSCAAAANPPRTTSTTVPTPIADTLFALIATPPHPLDTFRPATCHDPRWKCRQGPRQPTPNV